VTRAAEALAALEALGEARISDGLSRYGIATAERVIGVPMAGIQKVGKSFGRDSALAGALWATRVYEARLLVAYVADPALLTPGQMDAWTRDFDNWATCDTLCFALFDKSPHAFDMVDRWADDPAEFVKRTAFALLASLALHDKKSGDAPFLQRLSLIEAAASDERNFVKKGVSWALRGIGGKKAPRCALRRGSWPTGWRLRLTRSRNGSAGTPRRRSPRRNNHTRPITEKIVTVTLFGKE
jgi:3-methyladenine DNA glycosylase AlkD